MLDSQKRLFPGIYLAIFFAQGALIPYMTLYFSQDQFGLSPSEVGTIVAIMPILSILVQPLWGMLADRTGRVRVWLMVAMAIAAITSLGFLIPLSYWWVIGLMVVWSVFQSAHIPLADMMTLDYTIRMRIDYGAIRLYGSVGFAIAVFVMGRISDTSFGLSSTFILSAICLLVGTFIVFRISEPKKEQAVALAPFDWSAVWSPRFLVFLIGGMLVFGPIYANNYYFGLYVTEIGGSTTLVGMLFLVAVLCEIPFMRMATQLVTRIGSIPILVLAAAVSAIRNGWLALEPPLVIVWLLAFVQGLVVGLLIPVALQYVRRLVDVRVSSTAIGVYMALTSGLATAGFNLLSGQLTKVSSIIVVFWLYMVVTIVGALFWLMLAKKGPQT